MEQYKNYEYWIDKEHCRYWLQVSCNSCRACLFNTLCHLEHEKERKEKEKSDLDSNKTE